MIIPTTAIMLTTTITLPIYGQQDETGFNATDSLTIQNIPAKKVQVGDIDIAYKMLGKGDPILLFNGASDVMDGWDPSFPMTLSSNHTVIAFDSVQNLYSEKIFNPNKVLPDATSMINIF